jgi:hypothetical protein
MAGTARKTDPKLWRRVKAKVTRGSKGGRPGQWSARKAQLAVHDYKEAGGGYEGARSRTNHLTQWTEESWGTKSGRRSRDTGERYLPKKARRALSDADYARTTRKKKADTRKGRQVSAQPKDIAHKTAAYRHGGGSGRQGPTRAELYAEAKRRDIPGRSRMTKAALQAALKRKARR